MTNFVFPPVRFYANLNQILADDERGDHLYRLFDRDEKTIHAVVQKKHAFVLGEPGYGKSRILREVARAHWKKGSAVAFYDIENYFRARACSKCRS